jgi:hypothetical protein
MLAAGDVTGALAKLDPDIEWSEAESSPYGRPQPLRSPEEVWSSGEVDRLDELVAEDVIRHDPYDSYAAAGLEGLKASIRATRER